MSVRDFLPNKYIISFVIIPILFFAIFFILKDFLDNDKEKVNFKYELIEKVEEIDSDNDGLKDWEERLYGTDPDNPDTDGDGFSDGKEVEEGTDPKTSQQSEIINLDKEIIKEEVVDSVYNYKKDENLNKTDIFSRDLFVKILELKESGLINNEDAISKINSEIISENRIFYSGSYTLKDLNIKKNKTKAELLRDFKKFAREIKKDDDNRMDSAYYLISYIETEKPVFLEALKENFNDLEKLIDKSLKMEINQDISLIYLNYINSLDKLRKIVKTFLNVYEDPYTAIYSIESYFEAYNEMMESLRMINLYFYKKNI